MSARGVQPRGLLRRWVDRRRDLAHEWARIRRVEEDARRVVEELERRRDGMPPRTVQAPELRRALDEVT